MGQCESVECCTAEVNRKLEVNTVRPNNNTKLEHFKELLMALEPFDYGPAPADDGVERIWKS